MAVKGFESVWKRKKTETISGIIGHGVSGGFGGEGRFVIIRHGAKAVTVVGAEGSAVEAEVFFLGVAKSSCLLRASQQRMEKKRWDGLEGSDGGELTKIQRNGLGSK